MVAVQLPEQVLTRRIEACSWLDDGRRIPARRQVALRPAPRGRVASTRSPTAP